MMMMIFVHGYKVHCQNTHFLHYAGW